MPEVRKHVQYSDAQKKSAYEKAKGIIEKINTGSDFTRAR